MTPSILKFPLGTHEHAHTYSQITADFILDGDLREYRARLSKVFGTAIAKELYEHIDHILGSIEAKMTWRALAYSIRHDVDFESACARVRLPADIARDIVFLSSDSAYDGVVFLALEDFIIDEVSRVEERQFMAKLITYARRVAFTKLKFLANFDFSTDIEDYVQALLVKSMTTVWRYSHFTREDGTRDFLKILNYAKATLSNTALSIIRSNTLERRARVRNHVATGCGVCSFCLRGNPGGCAVTSPNYESVIVSNDSVGTCAAPDTSGVLEARMVLAHLISKDARVRDVFSQVFGSIDLDVIASRTDNASEKRLKTAMAGVRMPSYEAVMAC